MVPCRLVCVPSPPLLTVSLCQLCTVSSNVSLLALLSSTLLCFPLLCSSSLLLQLPLPLEPQLLILSSSLAPLLFRRSGTELSKLPPPPGMRISIARARLSSTSGRRSSPGGRRMARVPLPPLCSLMPAAVCLPRCHLPLCSDLLVQLACVCLRRPLVPDAPSSIVQPAMQVGDATPDRAIGGGPLRPAALRTDLPNRFIGRGPWSLRHTRSTGRVLLGGIEIAAT
mmetsp:Transcript_40346/g.95891  ORF Transcript_40346/g.95891 Transcript_40346/m.95891 type:complete len:226 (+) Transcript_40346:1041-1718(+)